MKLARASSYAVHALAYLTESGDGRLTNAEEIAAARSLPLIFLRKCMGSLEQAGIVCSQRGPTGGYRLVRPPAQVTLLEIIEAVEGPVCGDAPFVGDRTGAFDSRLQIICNKVATTTRAALQEVALADLAGKGRK